MFSTVPVCQKTFRNARKLLTPVVMTLCIAISTSQTVGGQVQQQAATGSDSLRADLEKLLVGESVTTIPVLDIVGKCDGTFWKVTTIMTTTGTSYAKVMKEGTFHDVDRQGQDAIWYNGRRYDIDRIALQPQFLYIYLSVPIDLRKADPTLKSLTDPDGRLHAIIAFDLGNDWQLRYSANDVIGVINKQITHPGWTTITPDRLSEIEVPLRAEHDAQIAKQVADSIQVSKDQEAAEYRSKQAESARIKGLKRDLTVLSNWTINPSAQAFPGIASPIHAKSGLVGIDGATVEVGMSCQPDETTGMLSLTRVGVHIRVESATIDKKEITENYKTLETFRLYTIQDNNAWLVDIKEEPVSVVNGRSCNYWGCWDNYKSLQNISDIDYWTPVRDIDATKGFYSNMFLVNYGLVEIRMNRSSHTLSNFFSACNQLTPKQKRLLENQHEPR